MNEKMFACCKSKSTQEIADALMASKHGATIADPLAVAALMKMKASTAAAE